MNATRRRSIAAFLTLASPQVVARMWLLGADASSFEPRLLIRAMALDIAFSLTVVALIARFRARTFVPLLSVCTVLVALASYASGEHVLVNGDFVAPGDLAFLADETFVTGSVLAPLHPRWLLMMILVPLGIAAGLVRWILGPPERIRDAAIGACFFLSVGSLTPYDFDRGAWTQSNPFLDLLSQIFARSPDPVEPRRIPPVLKGIPPDEGTPILSSTLRRASHSVLLIVLEGVSGAEVYPDYTRELASRSPLLGGIRELANRHLAYPHFVAQQRKTNRGLFALLCGTLPNLQTGHPKLDFMDRHPGLVRCLPDLLADAGYRTAFLQAADLKIMHKGRLLPRLGFEEVSGEEWFGAPYFDTGWGPSDEDFFGQVRKKVVELEGRGVPWFLTLLTAGTHHPYKLPADRIDPRFGHYANSARAADRAVVEFVAWMREEGILEDTLVLITSDESHGSHFGGDRINESWTPMVALTPDRDSGVVSDPLLQTDVKYSVLDYLGRVGQHEWRHGERSLFRSYSSPRTIVFGNFYAKRVFRFDPTGMLWTCTLEVDRCTKTHFDEPWFLWNFRGEGVEVPEEELPELRTFVEANEWRWNDIARLEREPVPNFPWPR